MPNPKLSIIIPCYNCEKTLREAVESCFTQGFDESEFEIVMVDDGSTDDTCEIINELAHEHDNIHTFAHDQNRGGGATRNTAVNHARAEKIFCLDSDDILPPGTMKCMVDFMNEKQCDAVGINRSIKFNGNNTSDIHHIDTFSFVGEKIPLESLLQKNNKHNPLYSTFMHTKTAFEKAGGYPTTHGFDTQGFAWRFLCAGLTAYTCPNAEYLHRINFHESYYLREANAGKVNYNWRDILLEHFYLLSPEAQTLLLSFNCKDFTQNLHATFKKLPQQFAYNLRNRLGKDNSYRGTISIQKSTPRNSLRGLWYRLCNYIRNRL